MVYCTWLHLKLPSRVSELLIVVVIVILVVVVVVVVVVILVSQSGSSRDSDSVRAILMVRIASY